MADVLGSFQEVGIELEAEEKWFNLDCTDDSMCLFESTEHAQRVETD